MDKGLMSAADFLGDDLPQVRPVAQAVPPVSASDGEGVPAFPFDAFDGPFADFARAVAESRPVPPELPFIVALSVVGALAGKAVVAASSVSNHETLPNLFVVAGAPTGAGKGLTAKPFAKPLRELQREVVEAWNERAVKLRAEKKKLEADLKPSRRGGAGIALTSKAEAAASVAQDSQEAAEARLAEIDAILAPGAPVWIDSEPTPESLKEQMATWGECGYLFNAEGEGFLQIVNGRYSDGQGCMGLLCSLWTGEAVSGGRATRRAASLTDPRLSVFLAVQPDLAEKLRDGEARVRGLAGRMVWVRCSRERAIDPDKPPPAIPAYVAQAYADACRELFSRFCLPDPERNPVKVWFDDDAAWHLYRAEAQSQRSRWAGEADAETAARTVELVSRIALCLHLMRHGTVAEATRIPLSTVRDAERVHAALLAPWVSGDRENQAESDEKALEQIKAKCAADKVPGMTGRDIAKLLHLRADRRDAFLLRMESKGRLKKLPMMTAQKSPRLAVA